MRNLQSIVALAANARLIALVDAWFTEHTAPAGPALEVGCGPGRLLRVLRGDGPHTVISEETATEEAGP